MERMQILVPEKQKKRVTRLARELNVSASEIYRRAVDAFDPTDDALDAEELEHLLTVLREATARANQTLDETHGRVQEAIRFYEARTKERAA